MAETTIEWTDRVWNFLRGCSIVSPGCVNCYAMKTAHRFSGPGRTYEGLTRMTKRGPIWTGEVKFIDNKLYEPLGQKKPQRWFANSMSDLFHEDVDDFVLDKAFAMMAMCPNQTFQILTKRPERMLEYMNAPGRLMEIAEAGPIVAFDAVSKYGFADFPDAFEYFHPTSEIRWKQLPVWPLPNVWLGVSVENQDALERIDILKDVPAAVRFVSFEPLLEDLGAVILDRIDWAIIGGESGPGSRICDPRWIYLLIHQCREQNVACFVKQLGRHVYGFPFISDQKGGDMAEWPEEFRIRQFPEVKSAV